MMCDSGTPFCINNAMACTAELPAKWQGMRLHAQIPELFVSSQAVVWKQRLLQKAYETLHNNWGSWGSYGLNFISVHKHLQSNTFWNNQKTHKGKIWPNQVLFSILLLLSMIHKSHSGNEEKDKTCCKNWVQEQNMAISNVTWQLFIHKLWKCKKIPKPNKTPLHFI